MLSLAAANITTTTAAIASSLAQTICLVLIQLLMSQAYNQSALQTMSGP